MQLPVNNYLTWQQADPATEKMSSQVKDWREPVPIKSCLPSWYTNLPANLKMLNLTSVTEDYDILKQHGYRSAKLCLGLRGIRTVGWTIPLTYDLTFPGNNTGIDRKETMLHPAMLTGSGFDKKNTDQTYEWQIRLLSFPWRARMAPGWRMMVTAHPLTWSDDWFCFSGCVDANYRHDDINIGSFWNFNYPIESNYNYYNTEIVIAIKADKNRTVTVPTGTCMFSLVPVYDPDYNAPEFKEFADFSKT